MIENIEYIGEGNIKIKVAPRLHMDIFEGNSDKDVLKYFNSITKGISWEHNSKKIILFEEGKKITGFPSNEEDYLIVIYPVERTTHLIPNYAIIYNSDGSIHKRLNPPKLISNQAVKSRQFFKSEPIGYFEYVKWAKDSSGQIVTSMEIGFDRDWYEERVIDPVTGEFGECLSSGRR